MTIFNLGSINLDHIYTINHLPINGETVPANSLTTALGGKGANQSIAIARANANVFHAGMIHRNDVHWLEPLKNAGVNTQNIILGDTPTGHAIVAVDQHGDNTIIIAPLSNAAIPETIIQQTLQSAKPGHWALAQNETNLTKPFLTQAKKKGLKICYSAAPFVPDVTAEILPLVDLLIINEIEEQELKQHIGKPPQQADIHHLIVTRGENGADYHGVNGQFHCPAVKVEPLDTTGAGDTYLGYVLACLGRGEDIKTAMNIAAQAAAIQVTRLGASAAIPTIAETKAATKKPL